MSEQEASKFPCESASMAQEETVEKGNAARTKQETACYIQALDELLHLSSGGLSASGTSFPKQSGFQTLAALASPGSSRCLSRLSGVMTPSGA